MDGWMDGEHPTTEPHRLTSDSAQLGGNILVGRCTGVFVFRSARPALSFLRCCFAVCVYCCCVFLFFRAWFQSFDAAGVHVYAKDKPRSC